MTECCVFIHKAGALPNTLDSELHTPLMDAAEGGYVSIVEMLIRVGAVVDAKVGLFLISSEFTFLFVKTRKHIKLILILLVD